ncbi:MAG: Nif3-like dinuclear metal center hexameric protein [Clostridiales bacterium GWB2_37_7]|nr:MAG: Nif3-like dinuclear metal center hexameric protein [Clostridiales bacterium GWB2_37_7]
MGTIKCQTIANMIEELAPKRLAEAWDNVGLLVGDGSSKIQKILVCLDATEWVIEEAIEQGADMIVCHHPIIFGGIKRITADTVLGRKLIRLISKSISVYCAHTNYDIAKEGLNDIFAKRLGFNSFSLIEPTQTEKLYKIIVYIPQGHEDKIFNALMKAGAGHIGNYSSCSFRTEGMGTFLPQEGTQPFIGQVGKLEMVHETKLGTIVPQSLLNKTIKALIKAHPYEEPAYDIMPLENKGDSLGLGRIGELEQETTLAIYADHVKTALNIDKVRIAGNPNQKIKKVAMLNGAGNKFVSAARFAGADVFVTGDMQYHEMADAVEAGISIIDAGHFATEGIMIPAMADYLRNKCLEQGYLVEILESRSNKDISVII